MGDEQLEAFSTDVEDSTRTEQPGYCPGQSSSSCLLTAVSFSRMPLTASTGEPPGLFSSVTWAGHRRAADRG
jgi:hypothetical protein